ncbi:MAG: glycoside hydrolase, partial [Acidobacteriota bacterium]
STPTGWRHVGQTAFKAFRPDSDTPFVLRPGDEVLFPATDPDAPFNRSLVPLADRFINPALQVNANARGGEARVVALSIMNPSTSNNPSQGSFAFDRYTFNYWQYIDLLVHWGGSAGEGLILIPNGGVTDAGHRNGVPVLGTIFLPPAQFGGRIEWVEDLLQRSGNTFPVADKLIEAAEYFGFDGWFINQETQGADAALAAEFRDFLRYLQDNSSLHIQWYDSMIESGPIAWQNQLNSLKDGYFEDAVTVSNSMFLNFFWNSARINGSRTVATGLGRDPFDVYAGVDVQANGFNTFVRWDELFPPGQPHLVSLGFFVPTWTFASSSSVTDFYTRANRFWVGANRDPADTTTASTWKGVANYVPAKSVIDSVPFLTHFNTGQGNGYSFGGERAGSFTWNNRGLQEILPTWRWRIEATSSPLRPDLAWDDAYEGGTQLKIAGDLMSTNLLDLYQTALPLDSNSVFQLAFQGIAGGAPSHLSVGLSFEDGSSVTAPTFLDVGTADSSGWNLVDFDLSSFAGETLAKISLRFDSPAPVPGYEIAIGRLGVLDSTASPPAAPSRLRLLRQVEADPFTASLRLSWDASPDPVVSYQVFRRDGDGGLSHLGGTANTAYFAASVSREGDEESTTLEVYAIGPDGQRSLAAAANFFFWRDTGVIFADGFDSGDTAPWNNSVGELF